MFWPCMTILLPPMAWRMITAEEYHISNHEYFRMLPFLQGAYIEFDQKYNIYKDVEDIKHNFKYEGVKKYYKTRRYVLDSQRDTRKNWYKEFFLYELGIKKEPLEEFAKEREGKRQGNWEILTSEEQR
jgi:hypothetical protein